MEREVEIDSHLQFSRVQCFFRNKIRLDLSYLGWNMIIHEIPFNYKISNQSPGLIYNRQIILLISWVLEFDGQLNLPGKGGSLRTIIQGGLPV